MSIELLFCFVGSLYSIQTIHIDSYSNGVVRRCRTQGQVGEVFEVIRGVRDIATYYERRRLVKRV